MGLLNAFLCCDKEGAKFHLNLALVWYLTELMVGVFFGIIGGIKILKYFLKMQREKKKRGGFGIF